LAGIYKKAEIKNDAFMEKNNSGVMDKLTIKLKSKLQQDVLL
jgi:hypothetical protein